jgi:hypothetical protein
MMRRSDRAVGALALIAALSSAGCLSGSLATNTGPRAEGREWSLEAVQQAHVGETVKFDFLVLDSFGRALRSGDVSDYAVLTIGEARYQTETDLYGHYTFTHRFEQGQAGQSVTAQATAYRQRDQRDYMSIAGEWMRYPGADDRDDAPAGSDSVRIELYQAAVELALDAPGAVLSPGAGVLQLLRRDGAKRLVYAASSGRRGFVLTANGDGRWLIRYEPTADELDTTGRTAVRFEITDDAGRAHVAEGFVETP